jgi:hypothetical protein
MVSKFAPVPPFHEILALPPQEAFPRFMQRWLGRPRGAASSIVADPLQARALRRIHAAYGSVPSGFLVNHLLAPEAVTREDGFTVFYVEEQGVWLWAIADGDLDAEDPPVWGRENEPAAPWDIEAPDVSTFLVQMALMSAALTAPHGAGAAWLAAAEAERVLSPLVELALPRWRWPGDPVRWYAGDDSIALTCPNRYPGDEEDPHVSLWLGSVTEAGVRFVEPHLSGAWDYYSPHDQH